MSCFPYNNVLYEISVCFVDLNGMNPNERIKIRTPNEKVSDLSE